MNDWLPVIVALAFVACGFVIWVAITKRDRSFDQPERSFYDQFEQ